MGGLVTRLKSVKIAVEHAYMALNSDLFFCCCVVVGVIFSIKNLGTAENRFWKHL